MYRIEEHPWGFRLSFAGNISKAEMEAWKRESLPFLRARGRPFGVFVDMRELRAVTPEVQEVIVAGQQLYKSMGLTRSVVIVDSNVTAMQFRRLARESGIDLWERYLSSTGADWEQRGMAWVLAAVEPELVAS